MIAASLVAISWFTQADGQTNVGGIYLADTVWTKAASPFVLTSDVQIGPGATLSIEPGVRISGSFSIKVFGVLSAIGTDTEPITFADVKIVPGNNTSAQPFLIKLRFIEMQGGSLYYPTGNAIYGSLTLQDSVLRSIPYLYLWYPVADSVIERNALVQSGGISVLTWEANTIIRNNAFYEQGGTTSSISAPPYERSFAVKVYAAYGSSGTIVERNSFLSTDRVALTLPPGYSPARILPDPSNAEGGSANYFGGGDAVAMTYDRSDDLASAGYIANIVLEGPDPQTPQIYAIKSGWNLIGNSSKGRISPESIVGSSSRPIRGVSEFIKSVWAWDAEAYRWKFYAPGLTPTALAAYALSKGYDVLEVVEPRQGLWLDATQPTYAVARSSTPGALVPEVEALRGGWNLIGTDSVKQPNAFCAQCETFWAWNAELQKWHVHSPYLSAIGGDPAVKFWADQKGVFDFISVGKRVMPSEGIWIYKRP